MADTTIEQISETYLTLDRDYEMLRDRFTDDAERSALRSARDAARDAHWAAAARILEDNNPFVVNLKDSLELANAMIYSSYTHQSVELPLDSSRYLLDGNFTSHLNTQVSSMDAVQYRSDATDLLSSLTQHCPHSLLGMFILQSLAVVVIVNE